MEHVHARDNRCLSKMVSGLKKKVCNACTGVSPSHSNAFLLNSVLHCHILSIVILNYCPPTFCIVLDECANEIQTRRFKLVVFFLLSRQGFTNAGKSRLIAVVDYNLVRYSRRVRALPVMSVNKEYIYSN